MKITHLDTFVLGTPWRDLTYVLVHTDDGLVGVGETRMLGHTQALLGYLREAAPRHIVGTDPFDLESLVWRMKHGDYGRAGEIAMSGIGCVEMACWDIIGKALGQPVWRLLGGKVRDRIKAYANGWYTVERSPDEFHAAAREVVRRGYRALKFDPFGPGRWELEPAERRRSVSLVEAVRDAVGPDVELLVEMHGRFTPAEAVRIAGELTEFSPSWIEEPVPPENFAALSTVAEKVSIPVATGERVHDRTEFRELFERRAADVIQPDIGHFGGILETRKVAATAETHYVLIAPHNVGGPVLTAANLHLAAATTNFKIQEHFNDFADRHVKQAAPGLPEVSDGYFPLPQAPGLGVELDVDFVREHPPEGAHFDLYAQDWQFRGTGGSA
ncbi:mandelate racemase/muconate lactonizing enzyme family protein [Saccharopolyspora sp. NFXS83]|uniref:mandelate racemase/muconate lactonizing enzyme family protein n=1 Tax=Saccharopolyspora sp. NFXS83 TaxID=2993560 RepID=UPI00224A6965|nr:mandelate racemase/muconate lactonizing enzyme family protein [Saccharopolyspora sp. NFXS83]MCX2733842.1 mandelate racemase/muconate lactonizing enzyme family protein [Saccharopolyspora sp. NFXS83]